MCFSDRIVSFKHLWIQVYCLVDTRLNLNPSLLPWYIPKVRVKPGFRLFTSSTFLCVRLPISIRILIPKWSFSTYQWMKKSYTSIKESDAKYPTLAVLFIVWQLPVAIPSTRTVLPERPLVAMKMGYSGNSSIVVPGQKTSLPHITASLAIWDMRE